MNIIFFFKEPRLGYVKTRLAKAIGDEKALLCYQKLLDISFKLLKECQKRDKHTKIHLFIADTPTTNYRKFLLNNWNHYYVQSGKNLGIRLKKASFQISQINKNPIIIIGSDTPTITYQTIKQSYDNLLLKKCDVCLGPAEDGGYYLVGINQFYPNLFNDIRWSHKDTLSDQVQKCNKLHLKYLLIEKKVDIDTEESYLYYSKLMLK